MVGLKKRCCIRKSRIRETPTLSTNADSRTDTNLKRSLDLSFFLNYFVCYFLFVDRLHNFSNFFNQNLPHISLLYSNKVYTNIGLGFVITNRLF